MLRVGDFLPRLISIPFLKLTQRPALHLYTLTAAGCITADNFAVSMGLPEAFRGAHPQIVHRLWQLRHDQLLFLRGEVDKATAVRLWDEQHEFCLLFSFFLLFLCFFLSPQLSLSLRFFLLLFLFFSCLFLFLS